MNDEEKELFEKLKKTTPEYPKDLLQGTRDEFSFNVKRLKKNKNRFTYNVIIISIIIVIILAVLARYIF
jgi:cytoskeletal protein RodZ